MFRRPAAPSPDDAPGHDPDDPRPAPGDDDLTGPDAPTAGMPLDLSGLPIAGITRRKMAGALAGVLAAWIVIVFARQVSEAAAATGRATDIAAVNVGLERQVAALDRELDLIGRQRYIRQEARAFQLGGPKEIAFQLAADAPPLAADAPGSSTVRLGARLHDVSPLERWLTVLFGPSD